MPQIRIFLLLFFGLNCFANSAISQSNCNKDPKIDKLVKKALLNFRESNFEQSLKISRAALNSATLLKDYCLISRSYNIIAANYNELSDFDKAIFFYKKSLYYANKTNNDSLKCNLYNNLGNMYCFEKKQFDKGISYYKKSVAYGLKINDLKEVYFTNVNITWAYFDIKNYDQGYLFLKYINSTKNKYSDGSTEVIVDMLNAIYLSYKNDNNAANTYFLSAIEAGKTCEEKTDLSNVYLEYSKFLNKIKRHKEAYEALVNHNKISEVLYNEKKLKKSFDCGNGA
ncbi:hypothetical protein [Flavobacterium sp. CGRL2]